jgi:hypothetical protein
MRYAITAAKHATLFWAAIFSTCYAFAQTPNEGSVVRPKGQLPIRESAPWGFFSGLGKEIGTTTPSSKYIVLDTKAVLGLSGRESWIKVQPLDGSEEPGWAYAGPLRSGTENFEVVK